MSGGLISDVYDGLRQRTFQELEAVFAIFCMAPFFGFGSGAIASVFKWEP
ncbi:MULTISPECIES: hypothetical protein [unclassified Nostoc]|nr:hypothetical protein [Nostoc sp. 'Peltigera membranacea cyanobiont' 232]